MTQKSCLFFIKQHTEHQTTQLVKIYLLTIWFIWHCHWVKRKDRQINPANRAQNSWRLRVLRKICENSCSIACCQEMSQIRNPYFREVGFCKFAGRGGGGGRKKCHKSLTFFILVVIAHLSHTIGDCSSPLLGFRMIDSRKQGVDAIKQTMSNKIFSQFLHCFFLINHHCAPHYDCFFAFLWSQEVETGGKTETLPRNLSRSTSFTNSCR